MKSRPPQIDADLDTPVEQLALAQQIEALQQQQQQIAATHQQYVNMGMIQQPLQGMTAYSPIQAGPPFGCVYLYKWSDQTLAE